MDTDVTTALDTLAREIRICAACPLHKSRRHAVPGDGDAVLPIMLVGEASGGDEDRIAKPFVGAAGKRLNELLASVGIDRHDVRVENVCRCVRGDTFVLLGNGRSERINKLVKDHYTGTVLSVDSSGAIIQRPVTGWYRNPRDNRQLLSVSFANYRPQSGHIKGAVVTEDHPILTQRGWIPAAQLIPQDKIATGTPGLSTHQLSAVIGMLLGNAYINGKTRNLNIVHSAAQADYLSYKQRLLANLGTSTNNIRQFTVYASRRQKTYSKTLWRSKQLPVIEWLKTLWRDPATGRRIIPRDLVSQFFNDFSLAIWYMDDGGLEGCHEGRPYATFATNRFSKSDVEFLVALLEQRGLHCRLCHRPNSYPGYKISLSRTATRELTRQISRFIPPILRYKLIPEFAQKSFDPSAYTPSNEVFWDSPVVRPAGLRQNPDGYCRDDTLYCIDVQDTHNFVTRGGTLHNCRPPVVDHRQTAPTADQIATCRPYLDRAVALLQPTIVVPLGATALSVFLPLRSQRSPKAAITIHECHGLAYWQDGRWVFPMYHPAWELRNGGNARHPGQLRAAASAREAMERDIRRLRYLLSVDTATRVQPWTAKTLHLISEPHTPSAQPNGGHALVFPTPAQPPGPRSAVDCATNPEFPGFLETYDGQWITHHDFLALVGLAATGEGVSGNDAPRAWLATLGYPTTLDALTRAQVSAALDAAERALTAQRATATHGVRVPTVHRRPGTVTTATWNTDRLHPMLRTASAIDELMRRATGLPLTRMNDTSTAGVITAIAREERGSASSESHPATSDTAP